MTKSHLKQCFQSLRRKGKSYWNLKQSQKQGLNSYEIGEFWSISSSGRTYPLKIPHGRVIILYRSIHNYSSIEDNTFMKERGMLGPYNSRDSPITIVIVALIIIVVPYWTHIFIIMPHRIPLLLFLFPYIIIVMSSLIILWPLKILYIERGFCHLYHPRIIHFCNVKEVSHSKRLILKSLIYIFFYFVSWLQNKVYHNTLMPIIVHLSLNS